MKQKILVLLFINALLFTLSCNGNNEIQSSKDTELESSENAEYSSIEVGYIDGIYCAEVEYFNPSTRTRHTYDLDVEVENGELTIIHWPNGGWLDDSHFYPEDINDGVCEFTSDMGYHYTITLGEFGGCGYTNEYNFRQDINEDLEATTCPKCGDEKEESDDYCYSCQRKINDKEENTCFRCGNYEYGINGGLCSNCQQDDEEN